MSKTKNMSKISINAGGHVWLKPHGRQGGVTLVDDDGAPASLTAAQWSSLAVAMIEHTQRELGPAYGISRSLVQVWCEPSGPSVNGRTEGIRKSWWAQLSPVGSDQRGELCYVAETSRASLSRTEWCAVLEALLPYWEGCGR